MFDAFIYLLGYLYCCWSLVLFWALSVAFWWWYLVGGECCMCCYCVVISEVAKTTRASSRKWSVDLSREGLTLCHGLNLNIPLSFCLSNANIRVWPTFLMKDSGNKYNKYILDCCVLPACRHFGPCTASCRQGQHTGTDTRPCQQLTCCSNASQENVPVNIWRGSSEECVQCRIWNQEDPDPSTTLLVTLNFTYSEIKNWWELVRS